MSTFNKLFSFSGGHGKDKDDDQPEERKSRSLFSSLTGGHGSSSSTPGGSSSMRSPSPYGGRQSYQPSSSTGKDEKHRRHRRPWKRHSRRGSQSHSEHEYGGATSSANVSEAESDGEGVLSRLASNSSSGTGSSTATAAHNNGGIAPLTSSTSSSSLKAVETSPKAARSANRARLTAVNAGDPQAGRGAPRNAYYETDEEEAGDDDDDDGSDDEEQQQRAPSGATSSSLLSPESARSASSDIPFSSGNKYGIRGVRVLDPTSDSELEDHSHEEYARYSDTDDGDEYYSNESDDDMDPTVLANTEANAGSLTAAELLNSKPALLAGYGDDDPDAIYYNDDAEGPQANWPNLVKSPATPFNPLPSARVASGGHSVSFGGSAASSGTNTPTGTTRSGRGRGGTVKSEIPLIATRPKYERNRCSITLTHGDPDAFVQEPGNMTLWETGQSANAAEPSSVEGRIHKTVQGIRKKRKGKTYVVASDLSEESYYAIEWAIGTVLRSGDELLFVTVMETDSKLDPEDGQAHDKTLKIRSQQERQTRAMQLSREATSLLERTRLHVRVKCQAIHAKNARHMLIDLIDYFAPTLVIIGSRGLSRLKGIILGSTSHYLIQKSSAPVMVTRRRLKPLRRPPRPISDLQRKPRVVGLANATIDVESHAGMVHQSHAGSDADDTDSGAKHRLLRDGDTGGETDPEQGSVRSRT